MQPPTSPRPTQGAGPIAAEDLARAIAEVLCDAPARCESGRDMAVLRTMGQCVDAVVRADVLARWRLRLLAMTAFDWDVWPRHRARLLTLELAHVRGQASGARVSGLLERIGTGDNPAT